MMVLPLRPDSVHPDVVLGNGQDKWNMEDGEQGHGPPACGVQGSSDAPPHATDMSHLGEYDLDCFSAPK